MPLPGVEHDYLRILLCLVLDEIIEVYNLCGIDVNGFVFVEIWRGMYGLPQAGIISKQAN